MRSQIRPLTGLRGISALTVMLYHFQIENFVGGVCGNIFNHCYLMVDLFLILSGFILAINYSKNFETQLTWSTYLQFLTRRIARIYPLYLVTTLIAASLMSCGLMDLWPGPNIVPSIFINLTMLQSILHVHSLDSPAWSVSTEWIANLVFPLLVVFCLRYSWILLSSILIIVFLILAFLSGLPDIIGVSRSGPLDIWHYINIYPAIRSLADFTFGIVVFRLTSLIWIKALIQHRYSAIIILSITIITISFINTDIYVVGLFGVLILSLTHNNNPVSKFMSSNLVYGLGKISYSIYLIHYLLINFMPHLVNTLLNLGIKENQANIYTIIVFAGIVIVLAKISYHFIEQPCRNFINTRSST